MKTAESMPFFWSPPQDCSCFPCALGSYPPFSSAFSTARSVVFVTGFKSQEVSIVGTGAVLSNPSGIFDFSWIEIGTKEGGELTWEGGTKSVAAFVERWAEGLGRSPV